MILSICIPVYNFDVNGLVNTLVQQINADDLDAEIVVIDDGSVPEFLKINESINRFNLKYIQSPNNLGRSKIRNLFLKKVSGDYLLFLDCDGKINDPQFLKNYMDFLKQVEPNVIYGGRILPDRMPDSNFKLRWDFASLRENLPVAKRLNKPYLSFQTNNFVVKKTVFESFHFNEKLNQYGYEDLLFAMDLKMSGIMIDHIENPIVNDDVESNTVFLGKARESAESLAIILSNKSNYKKVSELKLAKAYFLLKQKYLIGLFRLGFFLVKRIIIHKLVSGRANLRILDIYKLGILCETMHKKRR